jgi:hypothetical protein
MFHHFSAKIDVLLENQCYDPFLHKQTMFLSKKTSSKKIAKQMAKLLVLSSYHWFLVTGCTYVRT